MALPQLGEQQQQQQQPLLPQHWVHPVHPAYDHVEAEIQGDASLTAQEKDALIGAYRANCAAIRLLFGA